MTLLKQLTSKLRSETPAVDPEANTRVSRPFASYNKLNDIVDKENKPALRPAKLDKIKTAPAPQPPAADDTRTQARAILQELGEDDARAVEGLVTADQKTQTVQRYAIGAGPLEKAAISLTDAGQQQASVAANAATLSPAHDTLMSVNRGGASTTYTFDDEATTKMIASQDFTATDVGVSQQVLQSTDGTLNMRGDVFAAFSDVRGAAYSATWQSECGARLGAASAVVLVGGAKLKPLEWVSDEAAEHARGKILAQWTTRSMPVISGELGLSMGHAGGSLRAVGSYNKEAVYEVFVDPQELAAALQTRRGVSGYVNETLEMLKLKKAPIQIPKLDALLEARHANDLKVGESVRFVRTWGVTGGAALSAYGMRAGLYGSLSAETEVTMGRVDEHHYDVIVSPKKLRSMSANVDLLVAAEAFADSSIAMSMRRGYRVDVREGEARTALANLLKDGVMPGEQNEARPVRAEDAHDLSHQVKEQEMPKGVETLFMSRAQRQNATQGVGVPKPFFLRGRVAGLSVGRSKFTTDEVAAVEQGSLAVRTVGVRKEKQILTGGSVSHTVAAAERALVTDPSNPNSPRHFDGIDMSYNTTLTRVTKDRRAQFTRSFSNLFDLGLEDVQRTGDKQTYEVSARRMFIAQDIVKLSKVTRADMLRAAHNTNVSYQALADVCTRIKNSERHAAVFTPAYVSRATRAVQSFLLANGKKGVAALHRLAGGDSKDLHIEVKSSAFDKPVSKALTLQATYATANDKQVVKRGIETAESLEEEVLTGLRNLRDDPILRKVDEEGLKNKEAAMQGVYDEVKNFKQALRRKIEK